MCIAEKEIENPGSWASRGLAYGAGGAAVGEGQDETAPRCVATSLHLAVAGLFVSQHGQLLGGFGGGLGLAGGIVEQAEGLEGIA